MTAPLPNGSTIFTGIDDGNPVIAVPHRTGGVGRYGIGLFMACWLAGWAIGWYFAWSDIVDGRAELFTYAWLGGWTVAGAFAALTLYRILRRSVPEIFRLMPQGLRYDSGVRPLDISEQNAGQRSNWSKASYFAKRVQVDIDRERLASLRLRETSTGNRLTVDDRAMRLDLARDATEIEREWLYRVLTEHYSLAPHPAEPE